ncbi:Diatom spindle kinesin-1 [Cladobotryum mycophilum]|uniref:Diatom spindle kinesin-1 n=1 Tax=Cladobotryum mycophilum TaxID=491253 RepID=A0ABR0SCI3_9HYPO
MEEYILENVDKYQTLINKFKPAPNSKPQSDAAPSRDIVVSARVRPLSDEELETKFPAAAFHRVNSSGAVDVHELRQIIKPGTHPLKSASYEVDRAFGPESTTEQIYDEVVQQLIPWAWGGGISTLFAYGQTGSGKTFTVTGLEKLVAKELMEGSRPGKRELYVSIIELAGNAAHDLLNERRPVSVLEDSFGVVQLAGALEKHVSKTDDILGLIEEATKFRRTESTAKNDSSSRSHAICRIRIEILDIPSAEDGILYLIDLAGSEAARDRQHHEERRTRESRDINTSLSVLKDCIRGKAETDAMLGEFTKRKPHIPFRHSALTKVLKHVFDPSSMRTSKTVIIACINPSILDVAASKNTLRYAELLRVFVSKPKSIRHDPQAPMTWTNQQLKDWIKENSGTPAVNAENLAPTEPGPMLLRLPYPEFELRCLKTPGVTSEQARALKSKLWQMHIESQRPKKAKALAGESAEPETIPGHLRTIDGSSSREIYIDTKAVPFKERIRPGMVVSWTPPEWLNIDMPGKLKMVVILCPARAVGEHVRDGRGELVHSPDRPRDENDARYLCALVTPAILPGAYDVQLWRQMVVDMNMMNDEVLLEYDNAARFYYMAI